MYDFSYCDRQRGQEWWIWYEYFSKLWIHLAWNTWVQLNNMHLCVFESYSISDIQIGHSFSFLFNAIDLISLHSLPSFVFGSGDSVCFFKLKWQNHSTKQKQWTKTKIPLPFCCFCGFCWLNFCSASKKTERQDCKESSIEFKNASTVFARSSIFWNKKRKQKY